MRKAIGVLAAALIAVAAVTVPAYLWGRGLFDKEITVIPDRKPAQAAQPAPRTPDPAPPGLTPPLLLAGPVSVSTPGFWSWSLWERRTEQQAGSQNAAATKYTASMIKAWLAADYLRRAADRGVEPPADTMRRLSIMICDSDNAAAEVFWDATGKFASIERMIAMCSLTDTKPYIDWAHTLMSARDATRMGVCIADGIAAGQKWTPWLLNEMRSVRGSGRFGIISALVPDAAEQTAIKNGWVARTDDGMWHVNCLAIAPDWVLTVMTVYPAVRGLNHGADICKSVTQQLTAGVSPRLTQG
jgi:hypothetical protein